MCWVDFDFDFAALQFVWIENKIKQIKQIKQIKIKQAPA